MSSSGVVSKATLPVPPPFGTLQIIDTRTGKYTAAGLQQMQIMWAAIFGTSGVVDLESYLIAQLQAPPFSYSDGTAQQAITRALALQPLPDAPKSRVYVPFFPSESSPIATATRLGISRPDNTSITISDGILSATSTGTVTSVGLTAASIFSVTGSPVTTSGTIDLALANETANEIFAGPSSGGATTPTFRAMVSDDMPNSGVTAGSYTNADITVDAKGRVTAAASGSGGIYAPLVTGETPGPVAIANTDGTFIMTQVA